MFPQAQAKHRWRSVKIKHFPLCWTVPLWTASSKGLLNLLFFNRSCWHPCNQNSAYRMWLRIPRRQKWGSAIVQDRGAGDVWINSVTSQESIKRADWSVVDHLNSSLQHLIPTVTGSCQVVLAASSYEWKQNCFSATFVSFSAGHQAWCMCRGQKQWFKYMNNAKIWSLNAVRVMFSQVKKGGGICFFWLVRLFF